MNWFDICIFIVSLYSILKGYQTGFVKQLASLAGLIVAAILSGQLSYIVLPFMSKLSDQFAEPLSYIASFILIIAVFALIGHMLHEILETIKLGTLNKLAGAVLCFSKWILLISITINLIEKLDTNKTLITDDFRSKSATFEMVKAIAPKIVPYLKFEL